MIKWSPGLYMGWKYVKCLDCSVNYMGDDCETDMIKHCEHTGHGKVESISLGKVHQIALSNESLETVTVTLGYLTWNTPSVSLEGIYALAREAMRLRELGARVSVFIVDNGSAESMLLALHDKMTKHPEVDWDSVHLLPLEKNYGISKARNMILDYAVQIKSDYILLMDGDIEVVPYSVYHMVRYLRCHSDVGCIGAYPNSWTDKRGHEDAVLGEIPESRVRGDIRCAFTQYGLFRGSMFRGRDALRFEERGPFGEPGWGLEDDDMYLQLLANGWENKYFSGMVYLHRALHSSWDSLGMNNVLSIFQERKEFLLDKWMKDHRVDTGIISLVRSQNVPYAR